MTVITVPTVIDLAAVAAMGEADEHHRYELTSEGEVKIMTVAAPELFRAGFTDEQVRSKMGVFTGGGRQPDLTVWADQAPRVGDVSAYVAIDGLQLAVEVISPSSRRNDTLDKVNEYVRAGIERYWTIEQDGTQVVTRYALNDSGGDRRYVAQSPRPLSWLLDQDPRELLGTR